MGFSCPESSMILNDLNFSLTKRYLLHGQIIAILYSDSLFKMSVLSLFLGHFFLLRVTHGDTKQVLKPAQELPVCAGRLTSAVFGEFLQSSGEEDVVTGEKKGRRRKAGEGGSSQATFHVFLLLCIPHRGQVLG